LHDNAPLLVTPVALLAASGHVTAQKVKDSFPKIYSSDPRLSADDDNSMYLSASLSANSRIRGKYRAGFSSAGKAKALLGRAFMIKDRICGGPDGTRTRDLRRDRPAF
jgi:hypothetical protein